MNISEYFDECCDLIKGEVRRIFFINLKFLSAPKIPTVAVGLNWLFGSYFVNFLPFGLIFDPLQGLSV